VITKEYLPPGVSVKLEVFLPSLRAQRSGACLHTLGHVVRSEESGFAAIANMGFRMQFPETRSQSSFESNGNDGGTHEAGNREDSKSRVDLVSRFTV
jgi:hypothetical protein